LEAARAGTFAAVIITGRRVATALLLPLPEKGR